MTFITSTTPPTFKMSKVAATNLRDNPKLFVDYVLMVFFYGKGCNNRCAYSALLQNSNLEKEHRL